jgi:hypothetical protein
MRPAMEPVMLRPVIRNRSSNQPRTPINHYCLHTQMSHEEGSNHDVCLQVTSPPHIRASRPGFLARMASHCASIRPQSAPPARRAVRPGPPRSTCRVAQWRWVADQLLHQRFKQGRRGAPIKWSQGASLSGGSASASEIQTGPLRRAPEKRLNERL